MPPELNLPGKNISINFMLDEIMSIKSQKSLYEECSEIVERSYSVKSYSDESDFSCEDEDECLSRELLTKLSPAALCKLRRCFRKTRDKKDALDIDRRVEEVMRIAAAEEGIEFATSTPAVSDTRCLDETGFVAAINDIFGSHKYSTHATKLFHLLDSFHTGKVRWSQLLARLVAIGAKKTGTRAEKWKCLEEGKIRRLEHCKRECVVKLVYMERDEWCCYAAITRAGRVGIYSGDLLLLHQYEVFYHRTGSQRRVRNCWITDAIYLPDVQCLVLSASDRSLTIYDAAILNHTLLYCITGMPNIPTCLSYTPLPLGTSELCVGTSCGELIRVRFLQPRVALLYAKSHEHANYYFWMELTSPPHTTYVTTLPALSVHARSVRRVTYMRHDVTVSAALDTNTSVVIKHTTDKLQDYVFKVPRGVSCYHIVPTLHLLVTGSPDGIVRLYESTLPTPYAALTAPGGAAVLDVAVIAAKEIVMAFCSNCWLHMWDLYEECLLQTIKVNFPFLGVLGKKPEFGPYCIHPGPSPKLSSNSSTESLHRQLDEELVMNRLECDKEYTRYNRSEVLITCNDYVFVLPLHDGDRPTPRGPPPRAGAARTPRGWDLPEHMFKVPPVSPRPPPSTTILPSPSTHTNSTSKLLVQTTTDTDKDNSLQDLDKLLENAGLQGILEKDFVMMQGLKHDLNRKLAIMKDNMKSMSSCVSMGGAYLALQCTAPTPVPPLDDMMHEYKRVVSLFPELSLTGTPTVSNVSTPRKRNSSLLYVPSNITVHRRHNSSSSKD